MEAAVAKRRDHLHVFGVLQLVLCDVPDEKLRREPADRRRGPCPQPLADAFQDVREPCAQLDRPRHLGARGLHGLLGVEEPSESLAGRVSRQ